MRKQAILILTCMVFITQGYPAVTSPPAQCREPLGMHNHQIPDHAITASSSYDDDTVGPSSARIRTEENGGAWCPRVQIAPNVYEWLQIDLGDLKVVTKVETQGRFGNGQGQEFAEQYLLEYQLENCDNWTRFHNSHGQEIFKGNSNTYIAELREVNPPIIARRIRFIPYSSKPKTVCMRVEMYGCPWKIEQESVTEPYGSTQSPGTCWPSLRTKWDNMVKLSQETPILEMFLSYGLNMVFGIDLFNKDTLHAQLDQLVCKLDGVKSVSDLAEILPNVSELDVRRGYALFHQMFTLAGGMDTMHSVAAAYNDVIQLFIDMDFPHVPIRAMTRQEVDQRVTAILKKLLPIFGIVAAPFNMDGQKIRVVDALFDSPDIFVFARNMNALNQGPLIYQVGSDLPKWQQSLKLGLSAIEEFYSHGWMQLAPSEGHPRSQGA